MSKNKKSKKWCLVHIGNDITYGLAFVAGELKRLNHQIFWIDGDENIDTLNKVIIEKKPDYICFGPLSTEFSRSIEFKLKLFLLAETYEKSSMRWPEHQSGYR